MRAHGLTLMETDAHATADGVVVLHHDPALDRMCGRPGDIARMPWAELRGVRDRSGEPLVRLDEALAAYPEITFNVDAKSASVVGALGRLVAANPRRFVISSFSSRRLAAVERRAPGIHRSLGMAEVARFRALAALPHTAFDRLVRDAPGCIALQIPEYYGSLRVLTPELLAAAHRRGLQVHVWTVNAAEDAVRILDAGADGLVTDFPAAMVRHLSARGPLRR